MDPHSLHTSQFVNKPHTTKRPQGWRYDRSESWLRLPLCQGTALPAHPVNQSINQAQLWGLEGWGDDESESWLRLLPCHETALRAHSTNQSINHTQLRRRKGEETTDLRVGWGFHNVTEPHYQHTQLISQSTKHNYEGWKGEGTMNPRVSWGFYHFTEQHYQQTQPISQ